MRPKVNTSTEDRATDTQATCTKKFRKDRVCGSEDILADRQTDTQTDILITILRNHSHGRVKNVQIIKNAEERLKKDDRN